MSLRTRYLLVCGTWTAVVSGLLIAVPLAYRNRLPEPLASHWGPAGQPDGSLPLGILQIVVLALWALIAGASLTVGLPERRLHRRVTRRWSSAGLAWGGVFVTGLLALTVWANLGVRRWQDARPVGWQVLVLIAASLLAGWAGWVLAGRGPDVRPEPPATPERTVHMRPGARTVWVSAASNRALDLLGLALLVVAGSAAATGLVFGLPPWSWLTAAALGLVVVACLAVSSVRVQVSEQGLAIAFGAWRWPSRRIAVDRIEQAWSEERQPAEVGGWGYRGLPGGATIMIRAGECLVVRHTGGDLAVSVDDAATGAALLNSLLASRRGG
jgi:uncharacterized membrane protein YhaH (DUF805 family)